MIESTSRFVQIHFHEILADHFLGRKFWQHVAAGQPRSVKLKYIFQGVRLLSLRKILLRSTQRTERQPQPIRVVLVGFEDLDGKDVELLRSTLMDGNSKLVQFRLGLLVLDADNDRFFNKYQKAGGDEEGKFKLEAWRDRNKIIMTKFNESEVLKIPRMRQLLRIIEDAHVHIFGKILNNQDNYVPTTSSTASIGVQTCAEGHAIMVEKNDRVLSIRGLGRTLPTIVLRQHTQQVTYAGREAYPILGSDAHVVNERTKPPELTHQQVERDAYHMFVGWLSVLGIESGHPDDWDRTFSNGV